MMFPIIHGLITPTHSSLIAVLTNLSLLTNLEMVLDAGDVSSYSSGQSWLDRSGNGYDVFRGVDGGAATDDPTFNGTAGRLSSNEFWSFDGGDFFRYDSANETWMENLHKNNAAFTVVAWMYVGTNPFSGVCGNSSTVATMTGVTVLRSGKSFEVNKGGGGRALDVAADNLPPTDAWNFVGLSIDEAAGAGGSFFYLNGSYNQVSASDTFDGTYTSPSAAASSFIFEVSSVGNATSLMPSDGRLTEVAIWSAAKTKANLDDIFAQTRGRFGV